MFYLRPARRVSRFSGTWSKRCWDSTAQTGEPQQPIAEHQEAGAANHRLDRETSRPRLSLTGEFTIIGHSTRLMSEGCWF